MPDALLLQALVAPTSEVGEHHRPGLHPPAAPAIGPVSVRVLTSRSALARHARAWDELVAACDHPTPFATWEWAEAWFDSVAADDRVLAVLVADARGVLLGAAAFVCMKLRLLRVVPYRCLRYLGDVDTGGEYPQILVRRGCADVIEPLIAGALAARRDWDCIWLPNVSEWTGAAARLRRIAVTAGMEVQERPVEFGARALPATVAEFETSISGNLQSTLRRQRKKLLSAGAVELIACETADETTEFVRALFDLHGKRRERVGDGGCFARFPQMRRFYERFAPAALKRGWLRLYAAKVDGVVRAVQYGYVFAGTFYQLQEGFDPDAPPGIGNVLRAHVIEACIRDGVREYDFLGEFTEHKRRWGAERRVGCDLFLRRRSLKNRVLGMRPVWPTGRYLRPESGRRGDGVGSDSGAVGKDE